MTTGPGQLIEALRDARAYPHPTGNIELISTHISFVLLTGDFAYKIKKPVRFPFVDFSGLEARRRSCEDEVRLNRRLSEELYVDVVPIGGTPQAPIVGATPAIEYAVKMHQFDPSQTLDKVLDRQSVDVGDVRALAERIADFHGALRPTSGRNPERVALSNFDALVGASDAAERPRLRPLGTWLSDAASALTQAFARRERDGFVRECHGDLHLGNLVWLDHHIVAFDCLEFDEDLRRIDTLDEVAFLVMDFMAHERVDLAFEFLDGYLEISGDYGGLRELRFYLVHRALVRSYVRLLSANADEPARTKPYLGLAERLIEQDAPILVITHGLSGSGKTTVTSALIGRLPAIRVRSDVERKRLAGLEMAARSGSGVGSDLYSQSRSNETYEALRGFAETALDAGMNVIVDAAFLERSRRRAFAALAERCGARFIVLSVSAPETELRERVAKREARADDASEAGVAVLDYQLEHVETIASSEPGIAIDVDTSKPVDMQSVAREIVQGARPIQAGR
jgi:aminoglycoside phosphotransferase family enzyme/predicted kinase